MILSEGDSVGRRDRILAELQGQADAEGRLDWSLHFVDSTVVRAHEHAAGAKGGPTIEALGRSRGGHSTRIHLRAERGGEPMALALTAGERHEQPVLPLLMERGAVKRPGTRATAARRSAAT